MLTQPTVVFCISTPVNTFVHKNLYNLVNSVHFLMGDQKVWQASTLNLKHYQQADMTMGCAKSKCAYL